MVKYGAFGQWLTGWRRLQPRERGTQEWLARQCGYERRSTIAQWEAGEWVPNRSQVLKIGRLYSLAPGEVDKGLEAAVFDTGKVQRYGAVTQEERKQWRLVHGPWDIGKWSQMVQAATSAERQGELWTSKLIGESVLMEIDRALAEREVEWRGDEAEEATRLWLCGWTALRGAYVVLFGKELLRERAQPYIVRARTLLGSHRNSVLEAHADLNEADVYHVLDEPQRSVEFAAHALSCEEFPGRAFAQRLLVIDGYYARPPRYVETQMNIARQMVETPPGYDSREATYLLEGIGRAQGLRGDAEAMRTLERAESEAKGKFPVAYIMGIRSQMVACVENPVGIDRDRLYDLGKRGLDVARLLGWDRKVEQMRELGERGGVV